MIPLKSGLVEVMDMFSAAAAVTLPPEIADNADFDGWIPFSSTKSPARYS